MAATDERAIHEFPTGTIDDNSLLIMDRPTLTPGEYETEKFAIANLGLKLLGGIDFPNNLDTDEQDIFGAINEVNAKAMNIAAEYDETESYSKGDYCIYQNAAYRCIKASGTTTGTFVAADWTQIKVLAEVKANTGAIDELNTGKQDNLSKGSLSSGDDLDDISTSGFYWVVAGVLNRPISQYGVLEVCKVSSSIYLQRYTVSSNGIEDGYVYQRQHTSNGWKNWVKISA